MANVEALLLAFILAQQPEFEVASIKLSPPPSSARIRVEINGGPGTRDPILFTCENCSLSTLLMQAYAVKYYQLSGVGSRASELFNLAARVQDGTNKEQFRLMLQHLLADRFKLAMHRETKDTQMYDLVLTKTAPKLEESAKDAAPTNRGNTVVSGGQIQMRGVQESMEELAGYLSNQLDSPVTDATGLKGKYNFTLSWAHEPLRAAPEQGDSGPTLFSALQDQLGLKLAPKKGPLSIIVIDHAEKVPTGN